MKLFVTFSIRKLQRPNIIPIQHFINMIFLKCKMSKIVLQQIPIICSFCQNYLISKIIEILLYTTSKYKIYL